MNPAAGADFEHGRQGFPFFRSTDAHHGGSRGRFKASECRGAKISKTPRLLAVVCGTIGRGGTGFFSSATRGVPPGFDTPRRKVRRSDVPPRGEARPCAP